MTVAPGARLGHYTIVLPLGAGGMGEVWLAEDTTLKRKVALKVLPAGVATDPDPSRASGSSRARSRDDRLARFQREAEAVAALSHPNIVTIHSIEQDADVRFLTMERVDGQSPDQVIPRCGMPLGQVLEIGAVVTSQRRRKMSAAMAAHLSETRCQSCHVASSRRYSARFVSSRSYGSGRANCTCNCWSADSPFGWG